MKTSLPLSKVFDIRGRVAVITGGAGLLGRRHAEAVAEAGGIPVLADVDGEGAERVARDLSRRLGTTSVAIEADITSESCVERLRAEVLERFGKVDILVNNAANNPQVAPIGNSSFSRLESFPVAQWESDLAVGLKGAFLCSRVLGGQMARQGRGVILNILSDLAHIAPDQRLYRRSGIPRDHQPVKPVTYSVVKSG